MKDAALNYQGCRSAIGRHSGVDEAGCVMRVGVNLRLHTLNICNHLTPLEQKTACDAFKAASQETLVQAGQAPAQGAERVKAPCFFDRRRPGDARLAALWDFARAMTLRRGLDDDRLRRAFYAAGYPSAAVLEIAMLFAAHIQEQIDANGAADPEELNCRFGSLDAPVS